MDSTDDRDERSKTRPPWAPIGIIVAATLILPAFLYSVAPDEPLKEGVVAFSDGKQRVYFADPRRYEREGYVNYCGLESNDQVTVVQKASDRSDHALLGRFEGRGKIQFPFCPSQAEIVVKPHQVVQKESLLRELKEKLSHLLPQ